jgi:hypothetical protein
VQITSPISESIPKGDEEINTYDYRTPLAHLCQAIRGYRIVCDHREISTSHRNTSRHEDQQHYTQREEEESYRNPEYGSLSRIDMTISIRVPKEVNHYRASDCNPDQRLLELRTIDSCEQSRSPFRNSFRNLQSQFHPFASAP